MNLEPLMRDMHQALLRTESEMSSDSQVPSTSTSQLREDQAQVMTSGDPPYSIVDVNKKWLEVCEFSREEVIGKTQQIL